MKSIYASKLFQASTRKDRIRAALIAPNNLSLVQQLADDLDEEYQIPENLGVEEKPEEVEERVSEDSASFDEFIVDDDIDPESDLVTMEDLETPASSDSKSPTQGEVKSELPKGGEPQPSDPEDNSELIPESPANEMQPEASTQVESKTESIKAATLADLNILKSTLNSREDTAGVNRIAEKENEVWIYYKDDVNLNNIMTNVIEYLMTSGYESFEFNRLARSDNAIVFVTEKSTSETINSVEDASSDSGEDKN